MLDMLLMCWLCFSQLWCRQDAKLIGFQRKFGRCCIYWYGNFPVTFDRCSSRARTLSWFIILSWAEQMKIVFRLQECLLLDYIPIVRAWGAFPNPLDHLLVCYPELFARIQKCYHDSSLGVGVNNSLCPWVLERKGSFVFNQA